MWVERIVRSSGLHAVGVGERQNPDGVFVPPVVDKRIELLAGSADGYTRDDESSPSYVRLRSLSTRGGGKGKASA